MEAVGGGGGVGRGESVQCTEEKENKCLGTCPLSWYRAAEIQMFTLLCVTLFQAQSVTPVHRFMLVLDPCENHESM